MWAPIQRVYNFYLKVAKIYRDVYEFLLCERYDDTCDRLLNDAYELFVFFNVYGGFLLLFLLAFSICFNLGIEDYMLWLYGDEFEQDGEEFEQDGEDDAEKGQSVEPATVSPPPFLEPASPLVYPPPFEPTFKHFRGTGESFAPSHRYYNENRSLYSWPPMYNAPDSSEDTRNKGKRPIIGFEVSNDDEPFSGIETNHVEHQTPASPIYEAAQPPTQLRPLTPPLCIKDIANSPMDTTMETPPHSHDLILIQAPLLPNPPSPKTIMMNALTLVAQQESNVQEQMAIFLDTITTGAGYGSSADRILEFMLEAKQYLEPHFPYGLSSLPLDYRVWKTSIAAFWEMLSPHGWDLLHHSDSRVPEFIKRFHHLAIWFGLEELLVEFEYNAPPLPEPVLKPTEVESQLQEQPGVAQISFHTLPPETSQVTLPDSSRRSSTSTIPPPASDFNINKDGEASSMPTPQMPFRTPETPCPSRAQPTQQLDPAPQMPFGTPETPCPSRAQPSQQPDPVPSTFTSTTTPAPISFVFQSGDGASKAPPRAARRPQPTKSSQKPKSAPETSNLLDFNDPHLHNMPTEQLKALTWSSFAWPNPTQAAYKIWGHSTVGRLVLRDPCTPELSASYVKSCLESVASDFKRASIVLRLQARDCKKPSEHDLGMAPLFGEVCTLLEQAADFTNRIQELVLWDTQSQWYTACVFFRDAVKEDKEVWKTLCKHYGSEKYRALRAAWEAGTSEWLL